VALGLIHATVLRPGQPAELAPFARQISPGLTNLDLSQRLAVINQLLAASASNPAAVSALQRARANLARAIPAR
jgi:methionyl-tRNA formyltransferase